MSKQLNLLKNKGIVLIGISGKKGSGKDLFYSHVKAMSPQARRVAFADYLKHITRQQFGLSVEQTDGELKEKPTQYVRSSVKDRGKEDGKPEFFTPRQIMIDLGQFYRSIDPMFWVKNAFAIIEGLPTGTIAVITDVRFPNEADFIKDHGGFMVRLQRSNKLREGVYPGCSDDTSISEVALDHYEKFDYIVPAEKNENPQQLQQQVEKIVYGIFEKAKALV